MSELVYIVEPGDNAPPRPTPLSIEQVRDYLDYEGEQLTKRRSEIIAALEAQAEAYQAIDDDAILAEVSVNISVASALGRVAEDRRTEVKKPFREAGNAVDEWFKRFGAPLADAMEPIQKLMNEYGARKLAKQRAEDAERRRLAEAEANRLAAIASDRISKGKDAREAIDRAAEAATKLDRATAATNQRASKLTQTRSLHGTVASIRETWGWEVEDIRQVPAPFLMVNPEAVNAASKTRDATGKPTTVIPGIKWVVRQKMGVR